ncbi:MAG: phosphoribosylformylglycinamidine cyclo-ligase [Candidatus Krumholzibacteriaceae bacterium]|jgi:phosphoribosylformylglycinamidine cyclo-ligase
MAGSKYKESGVDIDAANRAKKKIAELARGTWGKEVLSEIGNFGGLFEMPRGLRKPVLVSSVDGVGTKLKVAFLARKHDTVGEDLVNHCVNDILVQGAEPLFFLDYIASGVLDPAIVADVVTGLARGCTENGCALIGGETAEMPGFYAAGEYDLAGCIIGCVELARVIDGRSIRPGDVVWALPSSGLHTNGYSLARKIVFDEAKLSVDDTIPGTGKSVREALLAVHRSYLPEIRDIRARTEIKGLAHITGGGLLENIPRILPAGTAVEIDVSAWEAPPLFRFLAERGGVDPMEMHRVFNMGVGMIVIVAPGAREAMEHAAGRWKPFLVGRVVEGDKKVHLV